MSRLILFNKPFQVLSQFTDGEQRQTLADYLPLQGVYPAGRLDYDSEGLLLLTDDGQLQQQISHPQHKMAKTYYAQVEGDASDTDLQPLRQGIALKDGPCRPIQVQRMEPPAIWDRQPPIRQRQHIPTSWLQLTLTEGRNRQVRRMTAAIGFPTLRLIRWQIGSWSIQQLAPGQWQQITLHAPRKFSKPRRRKV